MTELHFLWLCWGPVFTCYGIGWLIGHHDDWTGPAIIIPLSLVYGIVTYSLAIRWLKTASEPSRRSLIGAMIASPLVGIVLAIMIAAGVIG